MKKILGSKKLKEASPVSKKKELTASESRKVRDPLRLYTAMHIRQTMQSVPFYRDVTVIQRSMLMM